MDRAQHNLKIAEQLSQLRDLLIVIERSGDSAPDVLYKVAIEKSQNITALVETLRAEANPAPVEIPAEYDLWINNAEDAVQEQDDSVAEESQPQNDEPVIDIEMVSIDVPEDEEDAFLAEPMVEPHVPEPELEEEEEYIAPFVEDSLIEEETPAQEQPVVEVSMEIEVESLPEICDLQPEEEPVEVVDEVIETVDEPIIAEADEEEVIVLSDEVAVVDYDVVESDSEVGECDSHFLFEDDDDDDDDDETPDTDMLDDDDDDDDEGDDVNLLLEQELVIDEFYNRGEPFESEALTLGDMMSVRQAKELRKAFSLNDRFRFRRELFGNSDVTMNDTLNLIDTMTDYNEAAEYLFQDLGWSVDEPVVQEFLQLIERHFKQQ